jgi:GH24 family phage-related lysozyme (muramidase)
MIIKHSYIKQIGPKKFRVYSEEGKNMGTYSSREGAKKRLRAIEFFKHQNAVDDNHLFPRGGEGGVPEFFRKNLDYGERNAILAKRLKKLKTAKSSLLELGFKKEAAQIGRSIKDTLITAFLTLSLFGAGVHSANKSLESGRLKEALEDFSTEESPTLEILRKIFPEKTTLDEIISDVYGNTDISGKEEIAKELIKEYNPNLSFSDEGGLAIKDSSLFKSRAEVAYPDLEKIMDKFSERLSSGYDINELGEVGEMVISEDAKKSLMSSEGFSSKIYNDDRTLKWPKDRAAGAGRWTIGYGHKLSEVELDSGTIKLKDGTRIRWSPNLSESDALRVKANDLILNSILAAGLSEDTKISRPMFDALTDLSFNIGPGALSVFISSIRDDSGNLSPDLFAKEISGWTKVRIKDQRKGILIRRISQLLTARGVLIPQNPKHVSENSISTESEMSIPNQKIVLEYLKHFSKDNLVTESEVESILNALSERPPNSPSEFVETVNQAI